MDGGRGKKRTSQEKGPREQVDDPRLDQQEVRGNMSTVGD